MYYPYLRGKRFELYALQECVKILGNKIIPIIEPVSFPKKETGDLFKTLVGLQENKIEVILIVNPNLDKIDTHTWYQELIPLIDKYSNVKMGLIIDNRVEMSEVFDYIINTNKKHDIALIHKDETVNPNLLKQLKQKNNISLHICEEKNQVRNYGYFEDPRCIKLNDPFPVTARNADFSDNNPRIFTRWNQYFKEDGFIGFSDYLTIGESFSTGGYTPRVVAIHLTYRENEDLGIWLRHFVSKKNQSTSADVAGKYREALEKLILFVKEKKINNPAIEKWQSNWDNYKYPGLGKLKQYSIMNHLYVVSEAL